MTRKGRDMRTKRQHPGRKYIPDTCPLKIKVIDYYTRANYGVRTVCVSLSLSLSLSNKIRLTAKFSGRKMAGDIDFFPVICPLILYMYVFEDLKI
jgi:hypothetical protein